MSPHRLGTASVESPTSLVAKVLTARVSRPLLQCRPLTAWAKVAIGAAAVWYPTVVNAPATSLSSCSESWSCGESAATRGHWATVWFAKLLTFASALAISGSEARTRLLVARARAWVVATSAELALAADGATASAAAPARRTETDRITMVLVLLQ